MPGIERVRVSYLQPAELRPGLIEVIAGTPGVAPYFDLSFQHASGRCCGRMRRFGDTASGSWSCWTASASWPPRPGVRSNFIVGFPGETEADVEELERFLPAPGWTRSACSATRTRTAPRRSRCPASWTRPRSPRRVEEVADLAEELMAQRGADRIGQTVEVLIEEQVGDGEYEGRSAHQAPEVDGSTTVRAGRELVPARSCGPRSTGSDGVDLTAAADAVPATPAAPAQDPDGSPRLARWRIGVDLARGMPAAARTAQERPRRPR